MHHRKGGLSGSQRGDDAAAVTVKRRRKATSSLLRSGRNELLIAVVFTAVLTSIAVLTVVKLLASSVATTTPTTATPPMTDQAGKQRAAARRQSEQKHEEAAGNVLPWNPKYVVPESMTVVGDRSDAYVELRKATDAQYSYDPTRSLSAVQELVQSNTYLSFQAASMDVHHSDQVPYDINNCPETPPVGYPFAWNMLQILDNWGPDDTKPPASGLIFQGLCVFDYVRDYAKALTYRDLELPFVVINDPEVAVTVERWNRPGYMEKLMGSVMHRVEYSENNHFMYYVPQPKTRRNTVRRNNNQVPADWKPPTQMGRMTYDNWLRNANVTDDKLGPNNPHWYYRLIGCGSMGNDGSCDQGSSEFLFDEMTFFQPKPSLYIVEPEEQKG